MQRIRELQTAHGNGSRLDFRAPLVKARGGSDFRFAGWDTSVAKGGESAAYLIYTGKAGLSLHNESAAPQLQDRAPPCLRR